MSYILLSICIPTFERPAELTNSLESIISQPFFKDQADIEVVVYDSSRSSDSQERCRPLVEKYPGKIFYHKNHSDHGDENFEAALRLAKGEFRKLANDTLIWLEGSVHAIYSLVIQNQTTQPLLFTLNGLRDSSYKLIATNSINDFIRVVSYFCTWIGGFGIWKTDLAALDNFSRASSTHLIQVDVILRILSVKPAAAISITKYFDSQQPPQPKDYDLSQVFGLNYLKLLRDYVPSKIETDTYAWEKKRVLTRHILPFYFSIANNFLRYPLDALKDDYGQEDYFLPSVSAARTRFYVYCHSLPLNQLAAAWRRLNAHNKTTLARQCDISRITVGNYSYGPISAYSYNASNESLTIGHFVSLSEGVAFLLGGNHPTEIFSTYPFRVMLDRAQIEATSKGPIVVGDDVWIGFRSTILSGARIGNGAVIAAGSVVTGVIPPYAIAAGTPARVRRFRFSQEIIDKLLTFDFSTFDPSQLADDTDLYTNLDINNVDSVLDNLR